MSESQTPGGQFLPGQPQPSASQSSSEEVNDQTERTVHREAPASPPSFSPPSQAYPGETQQSARFQQPTQQYQQQPYQAQQPPVTGPPQQTWGAAPPSGPPPNPFADAAIKPGDDNRKWLFIGGGVLGVLLLVLILLLTGVIPGLSSDKSDDHNGSGGSGGGSTKSASATASDAKPFPSSDLETLLSSDDETASIVKPTSGTVTKVIKFLYTDVYDDTDCGPYSHVGLVAAYKGSGYSSVRQKTLGYTDNKSTGNRSWQTVVSFPEASLAAKHYQDALSHWQSCANKPVNTKTTSSDGDNWTFGDVTESDGVATKTMTLEGGDGWSCKFAMTNRNNLVFEGLVCGQAVGDDMASGLVKSSESKMPQ